MTLLNSLIMCGGYCSPSALLYLIGSFDRFGLGGLIFVKVGTCLYQFLFELRYAGAKCVAHGM